MNHSPTNPQLTVIIPLYNKELYISRAIRSVMAQTYKDFELIVVDDGSIDSGPQIASSMNDSRMSVIRQDNRGPGAARNLGIKRARGEYVAFLDADDEWFPDYLQTAVKVLDLHRDIATVSQRLMFMGHVNFSEKIHSQGALRDGVYELNQASDPELAVTILSCMSPCSTVTRKEFLLEFDGFYEESKCLYGEDEYLFLKILLKYRVYISSSQKVIYHLDGSELAQRLQGPHPIEPFLLNPLSLETSCPEEKRPLLRRILALRALRTADNYAIHGQGRMSRQLIRTFKIPGFMPLSTAKSQALSYMSPVLPAFHRTYRWTRGLVFRLLCRYA